jgi:hypothetical protein
MGVAGGWEAKMRASRLWVAGLLVVGAGVLAAQLGAAPVSPAGTVSGSADAKIFFLQRKLNELIAEHNRNRTLHGAVFADGTRLSGTEYTVTHPSTGTYRIVFNQAYAATPAVSVLPSNSFGFVRTVWTIWPHSVELLFLDPSSTPLDLDFTFMVMGNS